MSGIVPILYQVCASELPRWKLLRVVLNDFHWEIIVVSTQFLVIIGMNMWWILLALLLVYWKQKNRQNKWINIVNVEISGDTDDNSTVKDHLRYTSDQLRSIGGMIKDQHRRNIPNFETIRNVKKLKINKRRIRLSKQQKRAKLGINLGNLSSLPRDPECPDLSTRNIKIGTVNVRSLRGKSQLLYETIIKEQMDAMIVTESWLKNREEDLIWLKSQEFSKDRWLSENIPRKGPKKGGGITLILNKSVRKNLIKIVKSDKYEGAIWKLSISSKELIVFGIYHPPEPISTIFIDQMADVVVDLVSRYRNIIVLGDLNIHVNDVSNSDANYLIDAMSTLGFIQHVMTATHRLGNTLDVVFSSENSSVKVLQTVVSDMLSDHRFVLCELNIGKPKSQRKQMAVRKVTPDAVTSIGNNFNCDGILGSRDINTAVDEFESESRRLMDTFCPEKLVNVTSKTRVPWFNNTTREQRKVVRSRERVWLKYGEHHQWLAYKRERSRYIRIIRHNKTQVYSGKVVKAKGNTKKLYQIMYGLTGEINKQNWPKSDSNEQLAEDFAEFFLSKIVRIREQFKDLPQFETYQHDIPKFCKFAPLTETEVHTHIMSMKTKSCELDLLPTKILKEVLPNCISAITKLVNLSLESVFADNWKSAIVRPLIKKIGLDLVFKSFRPVSNLSFVSKLVEKAALKQFLDHCYDYNLIPDHQSAYRENHSCETAVIKLVNEILWCMENQKILTCIFMDLSAAFDTVDHDILLSILEQQYGISDNALAWYDSYLRPREFKVCVKNCYSKPRSLQFSVPQGSASGANIFTAYCSSIQQVIPKDISLQGFADDHFIYKLMTPGKDDHLVIQQLERTMITVKAWMNSMRLKLNTDKTEFVQFGYRAQLSKCKIKTFNADGDTVELSTSVRCLGAFLDSNLQMGLHVKTKSRIAMSNLMKIRNIRTFLTRDACETLVIGLVISHLDYCNGILLEVTETCIKPFQRIQAIAAKVVLLRSKYSSTREALKTLHWLPIRSRVQFKILTIMYKITNGTAPSYLSNLVTLRPRSSRNLRSNEEELMYIVPRTKYKTFAYRSFSVQGPTLWNQLPVNIKTSTSFQTFKKSLKTFLMSQLD